MEDLSIELLDFARCVVNVKRLEVANVVVGKDVLAVPIAGEEVVKTPSVNCEALDEGVP